MVKMADTSFWSSALLRIFLTILWSSVTILDELVPSKLEHHPEARVGYELAYFGVSCWSLGFFGLGVVCAKLILGRIRDAV